MGTSTGLEGCTKSRPTGIRFPDRPSVTSRYTDCAIPAPITLIVIKIMVTMLIYLLLLLFQEFILLILSYSSPNLCYRTRDREMGVLL